MRTEIKVAIGVVAGLAIGGTTGYLIARKRSLAEFETEIKEIKKTYEDAKDELQEEDDDDDEPTVEHADYYNIIKEHAEDEKTSYQSITEELKYAPFVIKPEAFGMADEDGYAEEKLMYYSDGVLVDEMGKPIVNIAATVGYEALTMFGVYAEDNGDYEDMIWVRNPKLKIDYEITKSTERYSSIPPEDDVETYDE